MVVVVCTVGAVAMRRLCEGGNVEAVVEVLLEKFEVV